MSILRLTREAINRINSIAPGSGDPSDVVAVLTVEAEVDASDTLVSEGDLAELDTVDNDTIDPTATAALQCIKTPVVCAVAQTLQPVAVVQPFNGDSGWKLEGANYFHQASTAGFIVQGVKVRLGTNEGVVRGDPGLAIHSTPEQFITAAAITAFNGTKFVKKAATTALTFTAAHVVSATKFGVILVELDDDGTIDTRVSGTPQTFATLVLAQAALPALITASLAAGSVPIGHIEIEADAGDWTANTDDLTDASDLTSAVFVSYDDQKVLTTEAVAEWLVIDAVTDAAAFTPVALDLATEADDAATTLTGTAADAIAILVTTDADGANLNAQLDLHVRPSPMYGE